MRTSSTAAAQDPERGDRGDPGADGKILVVCPNCDTTNRVARERRGAGARCGTCKEALFPGKTIALRKANFDRHIASNELPVVVDFWAPWCGPCRMMAPAYEQTAERLASDVRIAKLNTEDEPDIAGRFGIRGIPTMIAFRGGREVARQSGAMDLPGILGWIKANV